MLVKNGFTEVGIDMDSRGLGFVMKGFGAAEFVVKMDGDESDKVG